MQISEDNYGDFQILPTELVFNILRYVDGISLLTKVWRVCRLWRVLVQDEISLWKNICMDIRLPTDQFPPNHSFPWRWLWMSRNIQIKSDQSGIGCINSNSLCYYGDVIKGMRDGFGVSESETRFIYIGMWKDDKKHGQGIQKWRDGSWYDGGWVQGCKDGYGRYEWQDGECYVGNWKNDEEHGHGIYKWSTGDIYNGQWNYGKKHGVGKHTWGEGPWSGDQYSGNWSDDTQDGYGIYQWNDGRYYKGEWHIHNRHGYGEYTFPDGAVYKGYFINSFREGPAKYTSASGTVYSGRWERDRPINNHIHIDHWDGFFCMSKENQRNYVKEIRYRLNIS